MSRKRQGLANVHSSKRRLLRQAVIERDGLVCHYCGKELTFELVSLDHIIPWSVNPKRTNKVINLLVSCSDCNNHRGDLNYLVYCVRMKYKPDFALYERASYYVHECNTGWKEYIKKFEN